ncbi:hypothetical protein MNBD_GAMMA16-2246 [hydrothermal vent metagenome]|uniref:Cobalt transporter subunit CbtB (Proposed) n=1 Tax=hydrothermal vent metagenome TaxID=652676 RepID=A0A3B0ZY60_9ZZZZ
MQINSKNTTMQPALPVVTTSYRTVLLAACLGVLLLFVAGFAKTHVLHNAAHDSRHSAVFPCH